MRNSSTRRLGAGGLAALLALLFTFAAPALAGNNSDKGGPEKTETPYVSGSSDDDSAADADGDTDNRHPSGRDRHEDKGTQGMSTSDPDDNDRGPERTNGGPDKSFEGTDGSGGVDDADQDGNNGCGNDDDFEDDNEGWCGQKPKKAPTTPPVVGGGNQTPECPESGEMGNGSKKCEPPKCVDDMATDADECDEDDTPEVGGTVITCPKAGETLPAGSTMPTGCTTTTPTGTVTTETAAPGAVLAGGLQNAPAAAAKGEEASVLGVTLERSAPAAVAAGGATAPAGTTVLGAALARTGLSFTVLALAIALGLLVVGVALKRAGRTESDF